MKRHTSTLRHTWWLTNSQFVCWKWKYCRPSNSSGCPLLLCCFSNTVLETPTQANSHIVSRCSKQAADKAQLIIQSPKMLHKVDIGLYAVWEVALSCQKNLYSFFLITYSFKNGARICPMYLSEFTASKKMGHYFYSHQIILNRVMLAERTLAPVTYHECHPPPPPPPTLKTKTSPM